MKKLLLLAMVLGLLVSASIGNAADWKLYESNEEYFLAYYDTQTITYPSKNIVRVWERRDYTEKGVMNTVVRYGKEYENLSYGIVLSEFDCVEKKIRNLAATYYDKKERVIYYTDNPSSWTFISPGSIQDTLSKKVCGGQR